METYTKIKAYKRLHKFGKILFKLHVLKIANIITHDDLYYYSKIVKFKYNFYNPLTFVFIILYFYMLTMQYAYNFKYAVFKKLSNKFSGFNITIYD